MPKINHQTTVLVPCNGLSARGQLSTQVAHYLQENMDDVAVAYPTPIATKQQDLLKQIYQAKRVILLSGCDQQCGVAICQQAQVLADTNVQLGAAVRPEAIEYDELDEEERKQALRLMTSRVVATLTE